MCHGFPACLLPELANHHDTAEDKDNKLMSSEGLEATEEEMQEVLQDMEDEVQATNELALG